MSKLKDNKDEAYLVAMQDYAKTLIEYIENPTIQNNDLLNINNKVTEFFRLINNTNLQELDKSGLLRLNLTIGILHNVIKKRSQRPKKGMRMAETTTVRKQEMQANAAAAVTKSAEAAESAWHALLRNQDVQEREEIKKKSFPKITCTPHVRFIPKDTNYLQYDECNEKYTGASLHSIENLNGINHAVFICGDGKHVLELSALLETNNSLHKVDVVDTDQDELAHFAKLVEDFSKTGEAVAPPLPCQVPPSKYATDVRGKFKYDTNFDLYQAKIQDHLRSLEEKGKYYLYLSNTLFEHWINKEESDSLLKYIRDSPIFEDGTVIHIQHGLSVPILLKKEKEELRQLELEQSGGSFLEKKSDGSYRISFDSQRRK